jgi:hypothetical protein
MKSKSKQKHQDLLSLFYLIKKTLHSNNSYIDLYKAIYTYIRIKRITRIERGGKRIETNKK